MSDGSNERSEDVDEAFAKHGKVSYMQIPAADTAMAAAFYRDVFGWQVMDGGSADHRSFADASGELIGAFVTSLAPVREPGVLPYVYVDGLDGVVESIKSHGGEIVRETYAEGGLWVATFRDPAGNVMGIWTAGQRSL
jgi:predicted enzyme related to lactoylglutathione lyase